MTPISQPRIRPLIALFCLVAGFAAAPATSTGIKDLALVQVGGVHSTVIAVRNASDGSRRLFLVERSGTIEIYKEGALPEGTTTFLDIQSSVDTFFEGGLLGLAFHPDYKDNGHFFVHYTRDGSPLETVVERFTVSASDPDQAEITSRREIYLLDQPAGNHNGGDLHFGPDGYLYISLGDGGASSATSQNLTNALGNILRIDPCTDTACATPYTVPSSNPFFGDHPVTELIWASGLRNPYRFSFDRNTGDMFIADVGAGSREEVDFQLATSLGGENYGWNCREGDISGPGGCSGTFVEPVMVYPHSPGGNCSITGGFRYRGCIEGFQGKYVFADYCSARVWFGDETTEGSDWAFTEWDNLGGSIFGFGEDENGELYLSQGSTVYRFEDGSDCRFDVFSDGFESGDTGTWD